MELMMCMSILISLLSLLMSHPMSLGACLMTQTILFSLISGSISLNFWFSYILFLMMISGMLILFLYMTSIASNKKFKFSMKILILSMSMMFFMFLSFLFIKNNYISLNIESIYMNNNLNIMLNKFFNLPYSIILLMMMIYLLITLIATVKITNFKSGPLRQKF
uniref:NADH-ubiquinone oxidoreductase chain 6 n=1 Tax=Erotylidae sp. BMNH 1274780 TaxID=1796505 RepID=A0A126TGS9_9CUCU|nr:NADH dehydrogenase subunit 6 [Erotylidae sp. BMNH 1274780]